MPSPFTHHMPTLKMALESESIPRLSPVPIGTSLTPISSRSSKLVRTTHLSAKKTAELDESAAAVVTLKSRSVHSSQSTVQRKRCPLNAHTMFEHRPSPAMVMGTFCVT